MQRWAHIPWRSCLDIRYGSLSFVYLTHWCPFQSQMCFSIICPFISKRLYIYSKVYDKCKWSEVCTFYLQSRGAEIYAEFLGGSFTCDAYHMTEPHPDGMWGLQPFLSQLHSSWFYSSAHDSRISEGFSEIIFQQHYLCLYSAICQGHFKAPVAEDSYCFDKLDVWLGTLLMLQASPVFFANLISELCVFLFCQGLVWYFV